MIGQRLPDGYPWWSSDKDPKPTPPGSYWRDEDGTWSVCTPNRRFGNVGKHTVVEHEDRTITVSPSILVYAIDGATYDDATHARLVESHGEEQVQDWERGRPAWHGFLERGVWREC